MNAKCRFSVLIFSFFVMGFRLWSQASLNSNGMAGEKNLSAIESMPEKKSLQVIRAGFLNGPTAIPSVYMMETHGDDANNDSIAKIQSDDFDSDIDLNQKIRVSYQKFADPQSLLPKLIKNEIDVGFLPVNVAAKAYSLSNKGIVCTGITGNVNLVLITKDRNIESLEDLADKTVHVAGQGATPEYLFRWLLQQNNVSDVTLDYSIPAANLAGQIIADKISYAVVPEPFATIAVSKSKNVFYAIDFQEEYERIAGKGKKLPFTVAVARKDFAEEYPQKLKEYLSLLEESLEWAVKNPLMAGEYCQKFGIGLSANVAANAIPKSNYVFVPASKSRDQIEGLLNIFMGIDKKSTGSLLPGQDFYFECDEADVGTDS